MTQVVKPDIRQSRDLASSREGPLHGVGNAKYPTVGLAAGDRFKFCSEPRCHVDEARRESLRVQRMNRDDIRVEIDIPPSELEDFAASHARIERAHDHQSQMVSTRITTRGEKSRLLFDAQDSVSLSLIRCRDERLAATEGNCVLSSLRARRR